MMSVALMMAVNGPLMNYKRNTMIMSDSLTCGQFMAQNATRKAAETVAAPAKGICV